MRTNGRELRVIRQETTEYTSNTSKQLQIKRQSTLKPNMYKVLKKKKKLTDKAID